MLKNMNKYLKRELELSLAELKREQALFRERVEVNERNKEKLAKWRLLNKHEFDCNESLKLIIMLPILGFIIGAFLFAATINVPLTVVYGTVAAIIEAICINQYTEELKDKNKIKKEVKDAPDYNPADYEYDSEKMDIEYQIEESQKLVKESKDSLDDYYIYISLLNNYIDQDNVADKMIYQFNEYGKLPDIIKTALKEEWEAYKQEYLDPTKVDLNISSLTEDCYKRATKELHVDINEDDSRKEVGPMNLKKIMGD